MLTDLRLYSNQLSGTIPTLPPLLTILYLDENQLSGTIPESHAPLVEVWLSGNQLTGCIPLCWTVCAATYRGAPCYIRVGPWNAGVTGYCSEPCAASS